MLSEMRSSIQCPPEICVSSDSWTLEGLPAPPAEIVARGWVDVVLFLRSRHTVRAAGLLQFSACITFFAAPHRVTSSGRCRRLPLLRATQRSRALFPAGRAVRIRAAAPSARAHLRASVASGYRAATAAAVLQQSAVAAGPSPCSERHRQNRESGHFVAHHEALPLHPCLAPLDWNQRRKFCTSLFIALRFISARRRLFVLCIWL